MGADCLFTTLEFKVVNLLCSVPNIVVEANFQQIPTVKAWAVLTVLCLVQLLLNERCVREERVRRLMGKLFVVVRKGLVFG